MKDKYCLWLLMLVLLIAAGCGEHPGEMILPEKEQQIQSGGELAYGSLQEPDTLNPLLSDLQAAAEVGRLVFSGLLITNDKGEWIADLAEQVPSVSNGGVSKDGLTVTYKLRQGVTWHDGTAFTADDVKFTWEAINNPRNNIVRRSGYDKIAAVETPDKYTVMIKFKEYYAPHLTLFSTILPKHLLQGADFNKNPFNRAPVGTGPFKFQEWRIANAIMLIANSTYHKGKPKLNTIVYRILPDANIMLTQIKTGKLDIVSNILSTQLEQVRAVDGFNTLIVPNMIWEHLDFNLDNPLFQDVRVRQAIALAIDRPELIESVLRNVAAPATTDQSPLSWAYHSGLTPAGRDAEKVRGLLVQAGWQQGPDGIFMKNGRKLAFSLTTTDSNKIRQNVAQTIARQLREVGIDAEIRLVDDSLFFGDVLKYRRFETALYAWVAGVDPDNRELWHSQKIPSQYNRYEGKNYSGWRNAEIDKLTMQGIQLVDLEARKMTYFKIQELLLQETPVIPLYFRANIDVVSNKVLNYKPNPTTASNLWNAWEIGFSAN